jgi:deazaflavin-dependent oxidoreductase (nitroreductase family)
MSDATANKEMSQDEYQRFKGMVKNVSKLNVLVYKLTGGLLWNKMYGREICLLTMTGAKSGATRTIPVMYVPYKEGICVVASLGGAPKNPVWYNNLVAHPDIEFQHGSTKKKVTARLASGAELDEVWPICVEYFPQYADYKARTSRDIPVFICLP